MSEQPPATDDLLRWSESLAGLARTGLGFTDNPFEAERYEEILAIAADIRASAGPTSGGPAPAADQTRAEWLRAVGRGVAGYATPKVAIGAVVGDDDGRVLLIQRADSGVWLYPTGWADIGYSPSEVAEKEVLEETGIRCEVIRPLAIIDGLRAGFSRIPLYSIVFHCRATGGELSAHPHECLDVGWFGRGELPEPLASGDQWSELALAAVEGHDESSLLFDRPRQPVWRQSGD
ncbi:MAG: NUDIX hydrolase N-terminal domain-containing protein [Actinomycetota bacterium]